MTGAQGLSPEQLGALRSAELTEGSVNARNIFNQSEINRRNAVAEKNASDMLSANKKAQNMESVIKLGMMAKEYYPEMKSAVTGAYDYVTGAKSAVSPYSMNSISNSLSQETGTGQGVSLVGTVGGGATAYAPITNYAVGAEGAGTTISTLGSGELAAGTMTGDAAVGAAAPATAGTTLGSVVGGVATGVGYAAAGSAGRQALGSIFANQSNNVLKTQGEYMLAEPTFEGLSNRVMTDVFAKGKAWIRDDVEPWLDPVGSVLKSTGACIIVTACTDRLSYEVEVTRQYRDKFLTRTQLRGYYWAAEKLVPTIENNTTIRNLVKKHLVDKLVDYGEMKLGLKDNCKLSSKIVSNLFLGLIKTVGIIIPQYTRLNGEIY
jgi:hypothetical protein